MYLLIRCNSGQARKQFHANEELRRQHAAAVAALQKELDENKEEVAVKTNEHERILLELQVRNTDTPTAAVHENYTKQFEHSTEQPISLWPSFPYFFFVFSYCCV